jgi:transcriptional pleiotropic regulator of transition state genes
MLYTINVSMLIILILIVSSLSPIYLRKGGQIMKGTGIVRRLDELGRITLPIELRRTLDVGERDPLEIYVDEGRIILQKYEPADIFTGSKENLITYHDKKISKETIKELAKLAGIIE